MSSEAERIAAAAATIRQQSTIVPQVAFVTGTGLGALADQVDKDADINYGDIPNFPVSGVPGHPGRLVLGHLVGVPVAVLHGRSHLYEGWSARDIARPLRTVAQLGATDYLLTNCSGALNPDFVAPSVMLITDQINFTGADPGVGAEEKELGLRFPDLTDCYDPGLRELARANAKIMDMPLHEGIYCGVHGPALESPAERRFLRMAGGDAVGQSSVLEVIAARALQMRVLGLSALSNMATGGDEQVPDTLEAILAGANEVAVEMAKLIRVLLPQIVADRK